MSIAEERLKILTMIQEGKINPQEGLTLLDNLSRLEESTKKLEESMKSIENEIKVVMKKAVKNKSTAEKAMDKDAIKAEIRATISESKNAAREAAKEIREVSKTLHEHKMHAEELSNLRDSFSKGPRYFHLQVTDTHTGKSRVDVRMPVGVITAGVKMGAHFSPEIDAMDTKRLLEMISEGDMGKVIDIVDEDDCEHVVVTLE
jgi:hypothetical protein